MKLTIACPAYNENCKMIFATSLYGTNWPCEKPVFLTSRKKWVATALKEMVVKSKELKADFMIWISNDVAWKPDDINRLVSHNLPVVGGWACGCCEPFACHVCDCYNETMQKMHIVQNPKERHGLEKIVANGGEMLLFRMDIFDKIPYPWFFGQDMISAERMQTEDYFFAGQCRKYGVDMWVDWDVPVYHSAIGLTTYNGDLVAR